MGLLALQNSYGANSIQDGESGLPRSPLPRLSEGPRSGPSQNLTSPKTGRKQPDFGVVCQPTL